MSVSKKYRLVKGDIVLIEHETNVLKKEILDISPEGNAVCFGKWAYGYPKWFKESQFELIEICGTVIETPLYKNEDLWCCIFMVGFGIILGFIIGNVLK